MSTEKVTTINSLNPATEEEKKLLAKLLYSLEKNPTSITRIRKTANSAAPISSGTVLTQNARKLDKSQHYTRLMHHGVYIYEDTIQHVIDYKLPDETNNIIALTHPIKQLQKTLFPNQVGGSYWIIEGTLGQGSFGKIKKSQIVYWFDQSGNLHRTTQLEPLAIKSQINPQQHQNEAKVAKRHFSFFYSQLRENQKEEKIDFYMPCILGKNLSKIMHQNELEKLSYVEFIQVILNMAKEIQAMHQKGDIHGDLKPENMMCNLSTKKVTLVDFATAHSYSDSLVSGCHPSGWYGLEHGIGGKCQYNRSFKEYFAFASISMEMLANHSSTTKITKSELAKTYSNIDFSKAKLTYQYFEEFIDKFFKAHNTKQLVSVLKAILNLPKDQSVNANEMVIMPLEKLYRQEVCRDNLIKILKGLKQYQESYDKFVEAENTKGSFQHTFTGRINAKIKADRIIREGIELINRWYDSEKQDSIDTLRETVKHELSQLIHKFIEDETYSNKKSTNSFVQILEKYKNNFDQIQVDANPFQEAEIPLNFSNEPSSGHLLSNILNLLAKAIINLAALLLGNFQSTNNPQIVSPLANPLLSPPQEDDIIIATLGEEYCNDSLKNTPQ